MTGRILVNDGLGNKVTLRPSPLKRNGQLRGKVTAPPTPAAAPIASAAPVPAQRRPVPWAYIAPLIVLLVGAFVLLLLIKRSSATSSPEISKAAEAPRVASGPDDRLTALKALLDPQIRAGTLVVTQDDMTVRIRTTEGRLFRSGSDQILPQHSKLFERIGAAIRTIPGAITIEGHADSTKLSHGRFTDNLALSNARAKSAAALIARQVPDASRISAKGYGDSRPIASNNTAEGRSLNRRVEIVVARQ